MRTEITTDVARGEVLARRRRRRGVRDLARRRRTVADRTARLPHLDHDLAEGYVVDDELVCAGHGWAFDGDGQMYKRNEFGRVDPKGSVPVLVVREHEGIIEVEQPAP